MYNIVTEIFQLSTFHHYYLRYPSKYIATPLNCGCKGKSKRNSYLGLKILEMISSN